jgi:hypothetical protein
MHARLQGAHDRLHGACMPPAATPSLCSPTSRSRRTLHILAHAAADSSGASLPDACSGASRLPTSASTMLRMGVQHGASLIWPQAAPQRLHHDRVPQVKVRLRVVHGHAAARGWTEGGSSGGLRTVREREQGSPPSGSATDAKNARLISACCCSLSRSAAQEKGSGVRAKKTSTHTRARHAGLARHLTRGAAAQVPLYLYNPSLHALISHTAARFKNPATETMPETNWRATGSKRACSHTKTDT